MRATIVPGIHARQVKTNTTNDVIQPNSITASGGKRNNLIQNGIYV